MLIKLLIVSLLFVNYVKAEEKAAAPAQKSPWMEVEAKVLELKSKITGKEDALKKLFLDKRSATTPDQAKEVVKSLQSEHKELTKLIDEYDKARSQLAFQYPNRFKVIGSDVKKIKPEKLEILQKRMDVNSKLDEVSLKIEQTYQKSVNKNKVPSQKKVSESVNKVDPLNQEIFKKVEVKK